MRLRRAGARTCRLPLSPETVPLVFVVEDDPAVRSGIVFALEADGFSVRPFARARDAADANDLQGVACLIVDQRLPDEPGLAMLQRLRTAGSRVPAVLITSDLPDQIRRAAAALGVPIVEKPLIGEALFDCVRDLVSARRI